MLSSWLSGVFVSGMVMGIWLVTVSNSWLMAWLGLEINLICFIPFLMNDFKVNSSASSIYFLVQAAGSLALLMFGVSFWYYEEIKFWVNIVLLLKVGAAPFHFWYIQTASGINWLYFLVLSTIQKFAPLILLSVNSVELFKNEIYLSIIASGIVGGLGGLYTLSMRELLVYSSINHLGWMLTPLANNNLFWMMYLGVYCLLVVMVISSVMIFSIYHLNQMSSAGASWSGSLVMVVSMMSLGGLPPFIGFVPKWGVIINSVGDMNLLCLMVLIFTSVISLYYYMRASFAALMVNSTDKLFTTYKKMIFSGSVIFISVMGFWISPLVKLSFLQ